MRARIIAVWSASTLVVTLVSTSPVPRVACLLVAANMVAVSTPRHRPLRPLVRLLIGAGMVAVVVNVLLVHTGAHVVLVLPDAIPVLGGPLTLEGAAFGGAVALGVGAALLAAAPLSLALDPAEIVDSVPEGLERMATLLAASMAAIPRIGRAIHTVREAQLMRGWRPRGPRSMVGILAPALVTAVEQSVQFAETLEVRGYGATRRRTSLGPSRWRPADVVAVAACMASVAIGMGARLAAGSALDWYAFPALTSPPLDIPLVVAALLLMVPVVACRSSVSAR